VSRPSLSSQSGRGTVRSEGGRNGAQETVDRKGLGHEAHARQIDIRVHRAHQDNRDHVPPATQLADQCRSIEPGHIDVSQNHIDPVSGERRQRLNAVLGASDAVALFLEKRGDRFANGRFVVDDEYLGRGPHGLRRNLQLGLALGASLGSGMAPVSARLLLPLIHNPCLADFRGFTKRHIAAGARPAPIPVAATSPGRTDHG